IQKDLPYDIPVKNIHFQGLTFTQTDRASWFPNRKGWGIQHDWDTYDYSNAMLRFRGAENCTVNACHFVQGGGSAIRLDLHAQDITIQNNLIEYVGHMGILLCGYGPGTKDVNKNNLVHNNILRHTGELVWHGHAIFVWQSGHNTISNNWIYDVPRKAIGLCGVRSQILMKPDCNFDEASKTIRWHEIEATIDSTLSPQDRYFPYLHARHNIVRDNKITRTMLKLSDGSSLNISGAGEGNIIEHNFLYDLQYVGIRTDDWQDETYIRNNLLWNCKKSGFIFKGHNYLENNIAVNVSKAVHLRAFPQQTFKPGAVMRNNIFISDSEDFIIYIPTTWPVSMNIHKAGEKLMPYEHDVDNNIYFYPGVKAFLAEQQKQGIEKHSLAVDPGFRDVKNGDFRLKKNSPAIKLGFVPFETSPDSFGVTADYPENLLNIAYNENRSSGSNMYE
ncbi:MAG: right-handed parallel beta-helix repeat-containing protein, partial [Epsilonproteobacteria bacterium]